MTNQENSEIKKTFLKHVECYIHAMEYAQKEKSILKRCIYGVRKLGMSYVLYNLARYRIPVLFGDITATLFFGKRMILPAQDIGSYSFAMYGIIPHKCERKLTEWIITNVSGTDVFYDVGAHLGFYTALACAIVHEGEAHTFEANKKLVAYLSKNFSNDLKIHITGKAVASTTDDVDFYDASHTEDSSMSSRFNVSKLDVAPVHIPATTLDTYVAFGNKPPTVIKFDIEGGEYDAIVGAEKLLRAHSPSVLLEVWGGEKGEKYSLPAVKKLQEFGYRAYTIEHGGAASLTEIINPVTSLDGAGKSRDNFLFQKK